jgi:hypothetical protein
MKKFLFFALTVFCCSTTLTYASDNSSLYLDGIGGENYGSTPDNKPLVNSKLVHANNEGDTVYIDSPRLPTCNNRLSTPELAENLKNYMQVKSSSLGKDFY